MAHSQEKPSQDGSVSFKDTLNLPRTDFPIRPNPTIDDPALIARWQAEDLYQKSFDLNKGNDQFILHDGPPYSNGHIHLGHAYNKILKDIITKSQRMSGKHVPVTPGWDCHGLPIELKVTQEFPGLSGQALKKECRAYAQRWIEVQREEFKRLGVLMNWEHPYTTMSYGYEASVVRAFGKFVEQGYIEKKKKTVPWCMSCQTVLAMAEIEHHERKDPSIYVAFPLAEATQQKLFPSLKKPVSLLIWTTTPWTLPLNRAVLVKPDTIYQVLAINDNYYVVAKALADNICQMLGVTKEVVAEINGTEFKGLLVQHPFIETLRVPMILEPSVSLTDGTALVHCAPGCGPEDYEVALKNDLPIYSPITQDGKYAVGIEPRILEGVTVADGQGWVIKTLIENGRLLHKTSIKHSYPHCWRCRNGLIFRATTQWFCNLEHHNLKQEALKAIDDISFIPTNSRNFLKATVEGRLEWCLSRQRQWGVPIPALLCTQCDYAFVSPELVEAVARGIQQYGIEYWDEVTIEQLELPEIRCAQCASLEFKKEKDILDVWFESGVSHYAVLYNNPNLGFPADAYLEGVDQHRAWFQSSLLTSLALEQKPCTRSFITHGFTVDEKGHKMSKSLGNVVSPMDLIAKLGTDGLRLWASSIDYGGDAIVSPALLTNIAEVYRKIRNTCRFLLSNLYDFDHERDMVEINQMPLLDRYALETLFHLNIKVRVAYENADCTAVFHELADYCTTALSSLYLDIIKDRLYTESPNGTARRSAQTVCWYIVDTLTRLIAPVLSFTAEQISDTYQRNKKESIHLQPFNDLQEVWKLFNEIGKSELSALNWYPFRAHAQETADVIRALATVHERARQWELLFAIRDAVLKAIERQREQGIIKLSLEARIVLYLALPTDQQKIMDDFFAALTKNGQAVETFFKEFFIVSQFEFAKSQQAFEQTSVKGVWVNVEHAQGTKCPRCWQWDVQTDAQGLCQRCQKVLKKV